MSETISIRDRKPAMKIIDIFLVVFFIFNFIFITYMFDLDQLIVLNHMDFAGSPTLPIDFDYPIWPPKFIIDLNHWFGYHYDPALLARPAWWRATIWIDVLLFGPYYAVATFAFIRGKKWIRMPSIIWASVMLTNVTIILFSELFDPLYAGNPYWWVVILSNLLWILTPILVIVRMIKYPKTFEAKTVETS